MIFSSFQLKIERLLYHKTHPLRNRQCALLDRLAIDVHFHKTFAVVFHPLAEIGKIPRLRIRPEDFRHRAGSRPHLPHQIILIPGVLAPAASLGSKNARTEIGGNSRHGIETVGGLNACD